MIRSLLYVPASNPRFIAGAHKRGADAVVLDLEDAVAPNAKDGARQALAAAVPEVSRSGALPFVRVNAGQDRIFDDAEAACRAGAYAIYIPKVQSVTLLVELDRRLGEIERDVGRPPVSFVPLLEDPGAVLDARAIARGPRVLALSAGGEDLATALGGEPLPEVLRLPKLLVHLAAKAEGVLSFGLLRSVADYADVEGMRAAAREARQFGFDGASCIHPAIVSVLNEAFAPSPEQLDWARKVIAAGSRAEREGVGAFTLEGRFIDAPIVERARLMLAHGEAMQGRQENPT